MVASSNAGWGQGSDAQKDATALDVVEVHGDAGDVAGEPDPAAVRRDVDLLGDIGAVEQD